MTENTNNMAALRSKTLSTLAGINAVEGFDPHMVTACYEDTEGNGRMYLQAEFSRGAKDDGLRVLTVGVGLLEQGQSVGSRLSCSSLSQGYHIVLITKQIGYYLFLDWHRMLKAQFFDGAANVLAHAQFFKCLQCSLPC